LWAAYLEPRSFRLSLRQAKTEAVLTNILDEMNFNNRRAFVWQGHGHTKQGITKVFWAILRFIVANWLLGLAIRLAHFQVLIKSVSVAVALIAILLVFWALWGFVQAMLILGIKRILIVIVSVFILWVAINILTIPDTRPLGTRIFAQLSAATRQMATMLTNPAKSLIQAPKSFLFAYSGRQQPPQMPPGFPTPDVNATPVQVQAEGSELLPVHIPTPQYQATLSGETSPGPTANGEPTDSLTIGAYAQIANTGGQSLRARAEPGTSSEVVARFAPGTRLLILDGPIEKDTFIWWKVQSEDGEGGWCADRWLEPLVNQ
jgi:hypothetical protein